MEVGIEFVPQTDGLSETSLMENTQKEDFWHHVKLTLRKYASPPRFTAS